MEHWRKMGSYFLRRLLGTVKKLDRHFILLEMLYESFVMSISNGSSSTNRSSHWRCSVKKIVIKNFANFTGKHL